VRCSSPSYASTRGPLTTTTNSWDEYYERDLDEERSNGDDSERAAEEDGADEKPPDPSELDSWFDDVGAPAKTLAFLTSTTFPLSPSYRPHENSNDGISSKSRAEAPSVLDLGTGNGSALFALRLQGAYTGPMIGIDYSRKSIEVAEKLRTQYVSHSPIATGTSPETTNMRNIDFHVYDIINSTPQTQTWWPTSSEDMQPGFDLVLDKGTFDAISLSADTIVDPATDRPRRICELYPRKVLQMVKPGGFLMVTSCNWTEGEVISWFIGASAHDGGDESHNGRFDVHDTIKYPVYQFGGQKGQGVASVCFRKVGEE
jgi:SAM-dependent methyltransferase